MKDEMESPRNSSSPLVATSTRLSSQHPLQSNPPPSSSPKTTSPPQWNPQDPSHAPEVAAQDYEGLQVVDHDTQGSNSKYPHVKEPRSSDKQLGYDPEGLIPLETDDPEFQKQQRKHRICGRNISRRRLIVIGAVLGILVVIAAVGGGVGGYYASKRKSSDSNDPDSTIDVGPTQSPPPVTTGTIGLAALPCRATSVSPASAPQATPRDISNPYTSSNSSSSDTSNSTSTNATFTLTCRRGSPNGADALVTIKRYTTYTFPSCIDYCAANDKCEGVVYGANLTQMVADGAPGGNCLLKAKTWDAVKEGRQGPRWLASAVRE